MELDTNTNLSSVNDVKETTSSFFSSVKSYIQSTNGKYIIMILGLITMVFVFYNYYRNTNINNVKSQEEDTNNATDLEVNEEEDTNNDTGVEKAGPAGADMLKKIENRIDNHNNNKEPDTITGDYNDSSIQMPRKGGYCYIGEDRGHRSCMAVGQRDVCMSGDIFPSMEICINPNLRK